MLSKLTSHLQELISGIRLYICPESISVEKFTAVFLPDPEETVADDIESVLSTQCEILQMQDFEEECDDEPKTADLLLVTTMGDV